MKLTDYRYRKLRTAIKTSGVGKAVKEVLFCALKDYRDEKSDPEDGTFGETHDDYGKGRCLIGAGLHNIGIDIALSTTIQNYSWEKAACAAFGVTTRQAGDIINGFDSSEKNCINRKSRVQRIAHRLRGELIGFDKEE